MLLFRSRVVHQPAEGHPPSIQMGKTLTCLRTAAAEEIDRPAARLVSASAQQLFHQARNALKAQAAAGRDDDSQDSEVNTLPEDLEDEGSDVESNAESPDMDSIQPDLSSGDNALVAGNLAGLLIAAAFPDRVAQKRSRGNRCINMHLRVGTHLAGRSSGWHCKGTMQTQLCYATRQSTSNSRTIQRRPTNALPDADSKQILM